MSAADNGGGPIADVARAEPPVLVANDERSLWPGDFDGDLRDGTRDREGRSGPIDGGAGSKRVGHCGSIGLSLGLANRSALISFARAQDLKPGYGGHRLRRGIKPAKFCVYRVATGLNIKNVWRLSWAAGLRCLCGVRASVSTGW